MSLAPLCSTVVEIRSAVSAAKARGLSVGFVPTMGALHEGHAELIRTARRECGFVVVSIFVNPTQFGPNEDLAKYPRTLDADRTICTEAGADVIYYPTVDAIYPPGAVTWVEVKELDRDLCGASRPGHFRGVCTVVATLFNQVLPDFAFFGQKDGQQLRIIQRMVRDLAFPVTIRACPTVREADGLAMSSRNRYLNPQERAAAPGIYRALVSIRERILQGEIDVARLESALEADLAAIPGARVDYARIVDDESLQPLSRADRPALAAVAVFLGSTRLIDNITIP
jgi:pantoate--beta-alanine ligase